MRRKLFLWVWALAIVSGWILFMFEGSKVLQTFEAAYIAWLILIGMALAWFAVLNIEWK